MYNEKEDNNKSKINKQPEVPENQTAWNSNNQGIKDTVNQTNQASKMDGKRLQTSLAGLGERTHGEVLDQTVQPGGAGLENLRQGRGLSHQGWLKGPG